MILPLISSSTVLFVADNNRPIKIIINAYNVDSDEIKEPNVGLMSVVIAIEVIPKDSRKTPGILLFEERRV
jgi:hypothetical protein